MGPEFNKTKPNPVDTLVYSIILLVQLNKRHLHMTQPLTNECPYCTGILQVERMSCARCGIAVEARFPTSRLASLPIEHQRFIEMFVLAGGNLKEIAQQTGVSYPTIRSRLTKIMETLRQEIAREISPSGSILDALAPVSDPDARGDKATQRPNPQAAGELIKSI